MGRAMAVVLFTDLVGSTELRGRLGEEPAEEVRRTHDRLLTEAVEANSGRVVKGLGDGIMATFAGASDAVAAAVAIQQAIDRLNRSGKAAVPLAVRVGLSAGDVSFEDDDVHGTPVIEASRLCGVAGGGEILASEMVRWLARSSDAEVFTPVGGFDLKGLRDPIPVVRVAWEPAAASPIPMPALLTDVGRIFVGRDAELERLGQLWKEAAAGERRIALLAGEPGVGKTRLAAELAASAHREGAVVLAGRCDEDLGVPYQPFVEALHHFVDHSAHEDLPEHLGRYGGELARLVPELAERVPDLPPPLRSDPETERYRLFDAVAAWLASASVEGPLLLVLDDLQWAAKPTLLLLRHVVRSSDLKRVLVLGTYRDTELARDHPLVHVVADLRRQGTVERICLTGLDSSGVAAFMEQAAGPELDDEDLTLARAIHGETEGNPFFVREVVRHLAETGAIEQRDGRWTARFSVEQVGIPDSVRDVVGRRLSRLSSPANQALRIAAVVGLEFDVAVVQAAGGLEEEALISGLEEATRARLLIEGTGAQRYHFAHALVRDTLYGEPSGPRRVAHHRRVAEAIEAVHAGRLDDHLPALAHHWARASAPTADTARAVHYAARAGDRALAQLAHDEAVAYYRQALELLDAAADAPADGRRLELLLSLGEAQRRAGEGTFRETFLAAARLADKRGDPDALARAALGNYRGLWSWIGRVDRERVGALEQALRAQPLGPSRARAQLLANLAVEVTYAGDERRFALSDEALALARDVGDPATLARVLLARALAIWSPDTVRERLDATAELLAVADELGDPVIACQGLGLRWLAAMESGDASEADRCAEEAERLAADLAQPLLRWVPTIIRANRELIRGRIETSERLAGQALELGLAAGQDDAGVYFAAQLFNVRFDQGRVHEMRDAVLSVASQNPGVILLEALVALLHCELGSDAEAAPLLDRLVAQLPRVPRQGNWLSAVARTALVCAHLGDRVRARRLYDVMLPYRQLLANTASNFFGAIAHHLGALATTDERFAEAETHFAAADAIHGRLGALTWLARTRLEWARMLLTRRQPGDAERARELLGQTLASARELGLANVERRAVTLLQDCP
jgi:class 3 adenylate cyclase